MRPEPGNQLTTLTRLGRIRLRQRNEKRVGWLEFSVHFQQKYGHIRDERNEKREPSDNAGRRRSLSPSCGRRGRQLNVGPVVIHGNDRHLAIS